MNRRNKPGPSRPDPPGGVSMVEAPRQAIRGRMCGLASQQQDVGGRVSELRAARAALAGQRAELIAGEIKLSLDKQRKGDEHELTA